MSEETPTDGLTPEQVLEAFFLEKANAESPMIQYIKSLPGFSKHPEWETMTLDQIADYLQKTEGTPSTPESK